MHKQLFILFFLLSWTVQAQQIQPQGQFLGDSIKLGMEVAFTLSVKYPHSLDVVFPDSTFDYSPFEFYGKEYFPTSTDSIISHDSAIYYLSTFEVDSIQYLRLPVFLVSGKDSTAYFTATDSLILHHVVEAIPDSARLENMPLKENTSYLPLALQFNYPYLIIGIILFLVAGILVLIIFGKRIRKWWQLRRLKKLYSKFQLQFDKAINDPQHNDPKHVERTVSLWKKFSEQLSGKPYSQLTTKEIFMREKSESLKTALRKIDRSVYSGKPTTEELTPAYQELNNHADLQYNKRVEEIKHA